jgi:Zn-dependent protease
VHLEGLIFWFPAFLISTTLHEAAHAWAALRGGDPTAYHGGQVSLSPLPHIRREPVGMLVVPLFTSLTMGWAMGWASAPYDPEWARQHPRREQWMALAGPAANFAIALAAFALLKLGLLAGFFATPGQATMSQVVAPAAGGTMAGWQGFVAEGLSVLLMLNVILGAFNLLPLPPLDGASAIGLVLPERAAEFMRGLSSMPGISFAGLFVAWKVFPDLIDPLFTLVLALLHPGRLS